MSLATRCPACATTFKVVKDQLRISDGWVRCGRCSEVFDATVELHEAPDGPQALATAASSPLPGGAPGVPDDRDPPVEAAAQPPVDITMPEAPEAADSEPGELSETDFLDDEPETPPPFSPKVEPGTVARPTDLPPLGGVMSDEPWLDSESMLLTQESGRAAVRPPPPPPLAFPDLDLNLPSARPGGEAALSVVGEDTGHAQLQKALRRARVKSAKIARSKARSEKARETASAPLVLAASELEPSLDAGFRAPRWSSTAVEAPGFWQRAAVRRSLWALSVLAALLLAAQVLRQERDLIAARQPVLRPVLEALCGLTRCQVSALRQISDITIDGASFAREKSGVDAYRLSFTLRNAATVPLAMPAVELSLLDMQERAVVRRVLMPSEFGAPLVLPARAERSASLPLVLTGPEAALMPPVAGYRVVAFYP